MAYDVGLVFIFLKEFAGAGEGYLVDVAVHLVGCHTDTVVGDLEGLFLLVQFDRYFQLAGLAGECACRCEGFELLVGIDCIGHQLAQEYFVVAVKKLLDYRKYVLGSYSDLSFSICHNNKNLPAPFAEAGKH